MNVVFRALSDPTRLEILKLLRNGTHSSGDIAEGFSFELGHDVAPPGNLRDAGPDLAVRDGRNSPVPCDPGPAAARFVSRLAAAAHSLLVAHA